MLEISGGMAPGPHPCYAYVMKPPFTRTNSSQCDSDKISNFAETNKSCEMMFSDARADTFVQSTLPWMHLATILRLKHCSVRQKLPTRFTWLRLFCRFKKVIIQMFC